MLAVMSFSLQEGSLQLSDTSGEFSIFGPELITEICFSDLLFKLDYRPRMKFFKLDTSLHSITMVDHLHPDSLFPTLVQPKGSTVCNVYLLYTQPNIYSNNFTHSWVVQLAPYSGDSIVPLMYWMPSQSPVNY